MTSVEGRSHKCHVKWTRFLSRTDATVSGRRLGTTGNSENAAKASAWAPNSVRYVAPARVGSLARSA